MLPATTPPALPVTGTVLPAATPSALRERSGNPSAPAHPAERSAHGPETPRRHASAPGLVSDVQEAALPLAAPARASMSRAHEARPVDPSPLIPTLAPSPREPPWPSASREQERAESPPVVHVSIGRLELRPALDPFPPFASSSPSAAAPAPAPSRPRASLGLNDYLASRKPR
ncbi:hypothetical protein [Vitiosangium sp. GDMCC 1.1324]|uniref:hypothetical protein n=1 Tax=Vitiosangium sp. (strain GDMCC 1.1324) TaxID=2138576 RepID=UPI00130D9332|nr:hypothetical protein [Vitiosangium sp. GDMCC 1.1324]